MKKVLFCGLLASTAFFGMNQAAIAVPLATINSVTGVWSNVLPPGTVGLTGVGTSTIFWGSPATVGGKSGYEFDGVAPPPVLNLAENTPFTLGTFTHTNMPIDAGTSITGARLTVTINANFADGMLYNVNRVVNSVFDFAHFETPNGDSPCADGGPNNAGVNINGCADRVTPLLNLGLTDSFTVAGIVYVFATSGFDFGPAFWTKENAINDATFTGRFITREQAVLETPIPAALPLFAAGLAGIGYISRRQRKQKLSAA